jgi:uncharacterized protein (DUF362 family)
VSSDRPQHDDSNTTGAPSQRQQPPHESPAADDGLSRRDFLVRAGKVGIGAAATVGLAGWLLDRDGPPSRPASELFHYGNYAVDDAGPKLAIVTGSDRRATLGAALKNLGGIERFIRPGDRVLLKVNAAFATPPILNATAHPDLVSELARLCIAAGAAEVLVTDNPINDPGMCFKLSGIGEAARKAGAKLSLPQDSAFAPTTVAGGRIVVNWPVLRDPFAGVDKVIGVSPVKHHERSGASMSMKNWYGLTGGRRNKFHQDIHNAISELARLLVPTLVVLDGTVSMMHNGPTGGSLDDLKQTNTMIVSTDTVAADAVGAGLLGLTPHQLPYIIKGAEAGAGTFDFDSLSPVRSAVEGDA